MTFSQQYREYMAYIEVGAQLNWRRWLKVATMLDKGEKHDWFLQVLSNLGGDGMARGRATSKGEKLPATGQWTVFVDIPVSPEAWADIEAAYGNSDVLVDQVERFLSEGYRLSFSYNPQTDAVTCSMTCRNEASGNNGKTVTSFASNWVTALQVSLYKHYVVSEGDWGNGSQAAARPVFG